MCILFPCAQGGLSSTDNEIEYYDNELANFTSSNKKSKMSDSSLQRFTPDSGIALNYQSSVSSVGSLSPPVDKTTRDEFGNTFQKFDDGKIMETANPAVPDSHSSSSFMAVGSSAVTSSLMASTTCTTVSSNRSPYNRVSSAPTSYPPGGTTGNHKGTIPLSHAPFMQSTQMMMPSAGMHASASPGLVNSSHAMNRNTAPNAFQFNLPPSMMQQYSPGFTGHGNFNNGLSPGPSPGMFYHGMGSPTPMNMYGHATRPVPPLANSPGMFPHSSLPQPPPYRPYPGSPTQINQSYYPNSSPNFGQVQNKMASPQKMHPQPSTTTSSSLNLSSNRASNWKSVSPSASGGNPTTESSNLVRIQEITQHSSSPAKAPSTSLSQSESSLSSTEKGSVQMKVSPTNMEQALSPEHGAEDESESMADSSSMDDETIHSKR